MYSQLINIMKNTTQIALYILAAILSGVASYWALYRPFHSYNTGWDWFLIGALLCTVLVILLGASVTKVTIVESCGWKASGNGATRRSSADSGMEIIFALRDLDLQPYQQDHEGIRFKFMNRNACARIDDGVLNISVELPFDDLTIRCRREVSTRIDRIAGLHTTPTAGSDDLLVTAMVPVASTGNLTKVINEILETRTRMAVGLWEEMALGPANEVRRTTAVMLLREFFNEADDAFAAVCDIDDTNPLKGDDEKSQQFSAYLETFGIQVLPDNFSGTEKVKDVVKLISVYCNAETSHLLCRRAFLGTNV